jgi:hypothetical protein
VTIGSDALTSDNVIEPPCGWVSYSLLCRIGQAHAVTAAEPQHLHGDVARAQRGVVLDRLIEREQRVDRPLDQERRRGDLVDEIAGAASGVEAQDRLGLEERLHLDVRAGDVSSAAVAPAITDRSAAQRRTKAVIEVPSPLRF